MPDQQLAHIVYFTLEDNSDERIELLLEACRHDLTGHEGTIYFSVGRLVADLQRPVNQQFDVALHVIFADRESHDRYQVSERHVEFIEQNKASWTEVRVFDAYLA